MRMWTVMKTAPIQLNMREQRLRWYGHILRRQEDHSTKLALNFEAPGKRPRGERSTKEKEKKKKKKKKKRAFRHGRSVSPSVTHYRSSSPHTGRV
ncbi:unnamed protein product [Heligmosomoides polygyrus]|uniref:Uncharacterized protein n=1 Tax=Heligmosomoides polygyrus TaxID=6339 RepID=A0A183FVP3_HELPZ|nr:unnamed protein product [Heligmosomoides polygyrus]